MTKKVCFNFILKLFFLFFLVPFHLALLGSEADAAIIGISPGIINFPNLIRNGYAEEAVIVTTSSTQLVSAHLEISGQSEWFFLESNTTRFNFSYDKPYRFKAVVRPSQDAKNGNYTIIVRVVTDGFANVSQGTAGSAVLASVALVIEFAVTDIQEISCRAGAFYISSAEIGQPITLSATVHNDGNVRLAPKINIEIWDKSQEELLKTKTLYGDQILPTTRATFKRTIENDFQVGQYWAYVTMPECEFTSLLTFDVLEKGTLADAGEFTGIRVNEIIYAGDTTPVIAVFKNTGPREIEAMFKGQIKNLDTNKIVLLLESDTLKIAPDETGEFIMYFTPKVPGRYIASGRIYYNKKISFEASSREIKVVESAGKESNALRIISLIMLYVIIMIIILIIISKIRKQKKKFRF